MTSFSFKIPYLISKPLCKRQPHTPGMRSPQESHREAGAQESLALMLYYYICSWGSYRARVIIRLTGILEVSLSISFQVKGQ